MNAFQLISGLHDEAGSTSWHIERF